MTTSELHSTAATIPTPLHPRRGRFLLLVALVAALAGTFPVGEAEAMNPAQSEAAGVVWYVGGGAGSVDEFWSRSFSGWGIGSSYARPGIYWYNGGGIGDYDVLGCGNTSERHLNGFYCPNTQSIYLDYSDQTDRVAPGGRYTFGDGEVAGFLAHEWGHHVQKLLGYPMDSYRAEYHADCLAGMYMRYGYGSGRLTGADYWEFHNWLLSTVDSSTHGNPTYRTLWYRYGWDTNNVGSCNLAYG